MNKQTERTDKPLKGCPLCPDGGMLTKTGYKETEEKDIWVIGCDVCDIEVSNGSELICVDIWQNLPRTSKTEWASIDSAPRDGKRLLGRGLDDVVYTIKYAEKFAPQYGLREGAKGWYCYNSDNPIVGITHWMPLPKPPQEG